MAATPDVPLQSRIVDDKSPICIPFILKRIEVYRQQHPNTARPFIIGLNGIQGVGKTTLVRALAQTLERQGHKTLVVSIDDFYLTHADQLKLAGENPDNALVQCRGEPGRSPYSIYSRHPQLAPSTSHPLKNSGTQTPNQLSSL